MKRLVFSIILLLALAHPAWSQPGSAGQKASAPQEASPQVTAPHESEHNPPQPKTEMGVAIPLEGQELEVAPTRADAGKLSGRRKVPLKLLQAVRLGLERNIDIKKSLLDRATQLVDLELAERLFEPEFFIRGRYRYTAASNTDLRGGGIEINQRLPTNGQLNLQFGIDNVLDRDTNTDQNQGSVDLVFRQPLLRNAGITVGTAPMVTAQYSEESNLLSFRSLLMSRITSVQAAYWDLLLAMENRISTVRSLEASKEVLARNKELIRAGRKAPADLVSAQQEVARNRVNVLDQEFAVETANRSLVNLLDLENNVAILPVEGFVFKEVTADYGVMMAQAEKYNPTLLQSAITLRQRELDLKLARSAALDELNLEVSTRQSSNNQDVEKVLRDLDDLGHNWQGAINLTIPLGLPRDRLKQSVTRSARQLQKAKLDLKQSRLAVTQEVRDRVNDVNRTLRQIKMGQISRELAQKKYDIERVRLELGRSTNFQVLSYQRDLAGARDQEHQAIANYLKSLARLDEVVGMALNTWNVQVEQPAAPKIPNLNLDHLSIPPNLPISK